MITIIDFLNGLDDMTMSYVRFVIDLCQQSPLRGIPLAVFSVVGLLLVIGFALMLGHVCLGRLFALGCRLFLPRAVRTGQKFQPVDEHIDDLTVGSRDTPESHRTWVLTRDQGQINDLFFARMRAEQGPLIKQRLVRRFHKRSAQPKPKHDR